MDQVVFLKLGGSLITDKTQPYTPRLVKLAELVSEIGTFLTSKPDLHLILGHGSGSFGHFAVKDYLQHHSFDPHRDIQEPIENKPYWQGFSEVWYWASQLNRHVMDALHTAHIPAIAFAPSALTASFDDIITHWDLTSLHSALRAGVIPVIYGDIVFDTVRGGTILSTEKLMSYLAQELLPKRILLAGLENGVWADFPTRIRKVEKLTPQMYESLSRAVGASHGPDVTGGMSSKVKEMLRLVVTLPELTVQIFSGEQSGNLGKVLRGEMVGTLLQGN